MPKPILVGFEPKHHNEYDWSGQKEYASTIDGVVIVKGRKEHKQYFPHIPVQPNTDSQLFLLLVYPLIEHGLFHELIVKEIQARHKQSNYHQIWQNLVCDWLL